MDAYLVIGNPNTRKASVVRSLSGCFNRSVRDILPLGGKQPLRLYARVGSLQDTKAGPQDFIAEAARARCNAVLCCLAPEREPRPCRALPRRTGVPGGLQGGGLAHPRDRSAGPERRRRALAEPDAVSAGSHRADQPDGARGASAFRLGVASIMDRRSAVVGLATLGPMMSTRSSAQALRNARIAWVTFARAEPDSPFLQGFRGRLRELGWVEGRNLTLDIWGGDGTAARMKELVRWSWPASRT